MKMRICIIVLITLFSAQSTQAQSDPLVCTPPESVYGVSGDQLFFGNGSFSKFEFNGFYYIDFGFEAWLVDLNNFTQFSAPSAEFERVPRPFGDALYVPYGQVELWDASPQSGLVKLGPLKNNPEGFIKSAYKDALYTQVDNSLYVYDNTDRLNPIFTGTTLEFPQPGFFSFNLLRDQQRALIINTQSRSLHIVDLSNPMDPRILSESPLPEIFQSFSLSKTQFANGYVFMYLRSSPREIHVYSISEEGTFDFEAITDLGDGIDEIAMFNNRIWMQDDDDLILKSINPSTWSAETITTFYWPRLPIAEVNGLWLDETIVDPPGLSQPYVVVRFYDANSSTQRSPEFWASEDQTDSHYIKDDFLYIGNHDESSIDIYQFSNTDEPSYLGSYSGSGSYEILHVHSNTLFAHEIDTSTILSLDISNPNSPILISDQLSPLGIKDFSVPSFFSGITAFYHDNTTLTAYDMGALLAPTMIGELSDARLAQYAIQPNDLHSDQYAVFRDLFSDLMTVDISDPTQMSIAVVLDDQISQSITAAAAHDHYVYTHVYDVINDFTFSEAYDISDPANPVRVSNGGGTANTLIRSISISGDRMLRIGESLNGGTDRNLLSVTDISSPDSPQNLYTVTIPSSGTSPMLENNRVLIQGDRTRLVNLNEDCTDCPADLVPDHELTFEDVQRFIALFYMHDAYADFNDDGSVDFFDISSYLRAYTEPCN